MRVNRNSWHYKLRERWYTYNGWESLIQLRVIPLDYWIDTVNAVLEYVFSKALRDFVSGKRKEKYRRKFVFFED